MNDSMVDPDKSLADSAIFQQSAVESTKKSTKRPKIEQRDFYTSVQSTLFLNMIGAKNYDQLEDIKMVNIQVENAIAELKKKWKTNDVAVIK